MREFIKKYQWIVISATAGFALLTAVGITFDFRPAFATDVEQSEARATERIAEAVERIEKVEKRQVKHLQTFDCAQCVALCRDYGGTEGECLLSCQTRGLCRAPVASPPPD